MGFINAVKENPDDEAPRLIYADWLEEHDIDATRIREQCGDRITLWFALPSSLRLKLNEPMARFHSCHVIFEQTDCIKSPRLGFVEHIKSYFGHSWLDVVLPGMTRLHPIRKVYFSIDVTTIELAKLRLDYPGILFVNPDGTTSDSAEVVAVASMLKYTSDPYYVDLATAAQYAKTNPSQLGYD
jgi:uncharacterized protein (TIGR02996 family)